MPDDRRKTILPPEPEPETQPTPTSKSSALSVQPSAQPSIQDEWIQGLSAKLEETKRLFDPNFSVAQDRYTRTPIIWRTQTADESIKGTAGMYQPKGAFMGKDPMRNPEGVAPFNMIEVLAPQEKKGFPSLLDPDRVPFKFTNRPTDDPFNPLNTETLRHEVVHAITFGDIQSNQKLAERIRNSVPKSVLDNINLRYPGNKMQPAEQVAAFLSEGDWAGPEHNAAKQQLIAQFPRATQEKLKKLMAANSGARPAPESLSDVVIPQAASNQPGKSQLAYVNNNPGNIVYAGQPGAKRGKGGFAQFSSPQEGYRALQSQIALDAKRGMTVGEYVRKYVKNEPPEKQKKYIQEAAYALGIDANKPLSQVDPDAVAQFQAFRESQTRIGGAGGPGSLGPLFMAPGRTQGLVRPGNTDLRSLSTIKNPDGTWSTVNSTSFVDEREGSPTYGKEVLVRGILNGKRVDTDDPKVMDAVRREYYKTGKHLGIFEDADSADAYGKRLHEDWQAGKIPGVQMNLNRPKRTGGLQAGHKSPVHGTGEGGASPY